MSVVEKVIAILELKERELAVHRFLLSPLRHPSSRPQERAVPNSARMAAVFFGCSKIGGIG